MEVKDVICPFCGCLCDDIVLTIEKGMISRARKACAVGQSLFLNHNTDLTEPASEGSELPLDQAVEKAIYILSVSQHPLIYGLSSTTCEAQRKAIELAELLGGSIDSTSSVCHGPTTLGYQEVGEVTCTLGEIKNLSDLVVDVRRTRTAGNANIFLQVRPNGDLECLQALRAILRGESLAGKEIAGIPLKDLVTLAERMKKARFGVILFGMGLTMTRGRHLNVASALALVRDLNSFTKFVIMPMRGHFNVTGADATLTWTTGYPFAVNFSRGYPQYGPGEFSAVDLLARREVDAALIIASDPVAHFPHQAARYLAEVPTIVMDPKRSKTEEIARVIIPTARAGISEDGTAYRMDGVPLRLKKVLESRYPSDEAVLERIIEGIRANL